MRDSAPIAVDCPERRRSVESPRFGVVRLATPKLSTIQVIGAVRHRLWCSSAPGPILPQETGSSRQQVSLNTGQSSFRDERRRCRSGVLPASRRARVLSSPSAESAEHHIRRRESHDECDALDRAPARRTAADENSGNRRMIEAASSCQFPLGDTPPAKLASEPNGEREIDPFGWRRNLRSRRRPLAHIPLPALGVPLPCRTVAHRFRHSLYSFRPPGISDALGSNAQKVPSSLSTDSVGRFLALTMAVTSFSELNRCLLPPTSVGRCHH